MENDFRDHRLILHLNWKFALHNNFDWVVCCAYVRLDLFTCVQISVTLVTTCAHITGGGLHKDGLSANYTEGESERTRNVL